MTAMLFLQDIRLPFDQTAVEVMDAAMETEETETGTGAGLAVPQLPAALFTSGLLATLLEGVATEARRSESVR